MTTKEPIVWTWFTTVRCTLALSACKLCGKRGTNPALMVIVEAEANDKSVRSQNRYCPACYEAQIRLAHIDGELRDLPEKIKPDEYLSLIVPAYIVQKGDVLAYFKA